MFRRLGKFFDSLVYGMVVETDVKIKIRDVHDYIMSSSLHEEELSRYFNVGGGVFLDVGAHIGGHTLRVAKQAKLVIAIEPTRETYRFLVENIRLNNLQNVIPLNIAAWNRNETIKLYYGDSSEANTLKADLGLGYEVVEARVLDEVLRELGIDKVDLIKVDVEGAEYEVLEGLRETLKNSKTVIVEVLKKNRERVVNMMSELGYVIREVTKEKKGLHGGFTIIVFQKQ
ncbi:MAG: FkbM family methyltransferase [Pyrobaculum sp.]